MKKEVLDAYSELLPVMEEEAAAELKPEKRVEQKAAAPAVAVADDISADGVVAQISALRSELGRTLVQLSEKMERDLASKRIELEQDLADRERAVAERERLVRGTQKSGRSVSVGTEARRRGGNVRAHPPP